MDTTAFWLVVLSISTPVAGIVGFAIQLRQVRKTRLENEKLQLEIDALKLAAEARDHRIQPVTTDEVLRFGAYDGPMFSRGPNPGPDDDGLPPRSSTSRKIKEALVLAAFFVVVGGFVAYALYDIYRFLRWVANAL